MFTLIGKGAMEGTRADVCPSRRCHIPSKDEGWTPKTLKTLEDSPHLPSEPTEVSALEFELIQVFPLDFNQ
jgi:hypothetical protein